MDAKPYRFALADDGAWLPFLRECGFVVVAGALDEGDAVTIYSESLATGENRFPMSSITGAHAPFGRSAGFTNSIHDPVKKHAEACDEIDQVSLEYLKVTHALK